VIQGFAGIYHFSCVLAVGGGLGSVVGRVTAVLCRVLTVLGSSRSVLGGLANVVHDGLGGLGELGAVLRRRLPVVSSPPVVFPRGDSIVVCVLVWALLDEVAQVPGHGATLCGCGPVVSLPVTIDSGRDDRVDVSVTIKGLSVSVVGDRVTPVGGVISFVRDLIADVGGPVARVGRGLPVPRGV